MDVKLDTDIEWIREELRRDQLGVLHTSEAPKDHGGIVDELDPATHHIMCAKPDLIPWPNHLPRGAQLDSD